MESSDTYILTWTSSASATGWRCPNFTIWTLGMLLLDMSVEGWIAQIGLWTITALEVTTFDVILGAAFALATSIIISAIIIVAIVIADSNCISILALTTAHVLHLASSCVCHVLDHVRSAKITIRQLLTTGRLPTTYSVWHLVLARTIMHESHLGHLIISSTVPVGPAVLLMGLLV